VNYKIKFDDGQEIAYHINKLKKCISWDNINAREGTTPVTHGVQQTSHGDKDEINDGNDSLDEIAAVVEES